MWNEGGHGLRDLDEGYRSYGEGLDWREGGYGAGEERYGQRPYGQSSGRPSGGQAYGNYGGAAPNYGGGMGYGDEYGSRSDQEFGPYRGRGPRGYRRSDERIREEVCDSLADDDRLDASNIEVTVKDGEVQLSGAVNSREDKRWAEMLAERISGVKEVQNSVRVQEQQRSQTGAAGQTGTTTTGSTATGTTSTTGKGKDIQH